ncbi:hypothetical protein V2G26_016962 [Clonostachys chloroleuca]
MITQISHILSTRLIDLIVRHKEKAGAYGRSIFRTSASSEVLWRVVLSNAQDASNIALEWERAPCSKYTEYHIVGETQQRNRNTWLITNKGGFAGSGASMQDTGRAATMAERDSC